MKGELKHAAMVPIMRANLIKDEESFAYEFKLEISFLKKTTILIGGIFYEIDSGIKPSRIF